MRRRFFRETERDEGAAAVARTLFSASDGRGRDVRLRRIAELEEARKALADQDAYVRAQQAQADIAVVTHDDLRWADGIAWGTPTRYGNMSAQMKQFIDTTGGLWLKGSTRRSSSVLRSRFRSGWQDSTAGLMGILALRYNWSSPMATRCAPGRWWLPLERATAAP
jgi:hypothetical protein